MGRLSPPRLGIEPSSPAWQAGILTDILTRPDPGTDLYQAHRDTEVCRRNLKVSKTSSSFAGSWVPFPEIRTNFLQKKDSKKNNVERSFCFHPGSNWGSPACQADGLTNFPMKARSLSDRYTYEVPGGTFTNISYGKSMYDVQKKISGRTQIRTGDLSICSRLLYHWAIHPLTAISVRLNFRLYSYAQNQPRYCNM